MGACSPEFKGTFIEVSTNALKKKPKAPPFWNTLGLRSHVIHFSLQLAQVSTAPEGVTSPARTL